MCLTCKAAVLVQWRRSWRRNAQSYDTQCTGSSSSLHLQKEDWTPPVNRTLTCTQFRHGTTGNAYHYDSWAKTGLTQPK